MTKPAQPYKLKFHPEALQEWHKLDGSIRKTLKQQLAARLANPHVPGGALQGDLRGCYKIKLHRQGYRLVYCVEDDALVVLVLAVGKREEEAAYRAALGRVSADSVPRKLAGRFRR